MDRRYNFLKKITLFIVFLLVFIYSLIEARDFLVPLLLGILFSYLLFPVVGFLEKHRFPRIISILIGIIVGIFIIVMMVNFFSNQVSVFADDLPQIRQQAAQNWANIKSNISDATGISRERLEGWEDEITGIFEATDGFLMTIFDTTTTTVLWTGLMPVFVFFILYYRDKFHEFLVRMVPENKNQKLEHMLAEVNLVTKKYMTGLFIVVIILSITHSGALMIIGIDYPIFFGVTAALFNIIPYFGTLLGAAIPILYALLAMEGTNYVLWVLLYFVFIQFVENNILTPNITGGYVSLNPFVTILSLMFGSLVWGIAGMFLIVPLVAMFKIFCDHISFLRPIGFLLSDKGAEEHSLTWARIKGIFSSKKK